MNKRCHICLEDFKFKKSIKLCCDAYICEGCIHDLFKNEHDKLRSILCMITAYQDKQSEMHRFINIVNSSKTLAQVKKKLGIHDKKSRKSSRKRSRKASVKHIK